MHRIYVVEVVIIVMCICTLTMHVHSHTCLYIQIILMTVSIPAERTEFIYESRELFANLFIKDFDRENPRAVHKIYTVRDMYEELEYIAHHVRICGVCTYVENALG